MTECDERGPDEPRTGRNGRAFLKLAVLVGVVVGGLLVARYTPLGTYLSRDGIGRGIVALERSPMAPLVFMAVYTLATAIAIPGTVLTLAGGALFGVVWGSLFNWIAANLGANAAFGIARFLGRDAIEKVTGDRLSKLDRATEEHGFQGLLTLRLIPLVPFNALNFGSGLTAMSWKAYALATAIGILPGTVVYTFFADSLLAGSREASREALLRVALAGGLLILLTFLPRILKRLGVRLPGAGAVVAAALLLTAGAGAGDGSRPLGGESLDPSATGVQVSDDIVDHAPFTALLARFVDSDGVDYRTLKAVRGALDRYLGSLASVPADSVASASSSAYLAFWINAYNACMLRLFIDNYPIEPSGGL